jgi:non-specific serine/threonine protein kinase
MPLTIGTRLGSHEIIALMGKGGMGEVYRARDLKLKREVAIKILPEDFARDADRISRFQHEAEVLASLNHPNIEAIHDLQETNGTRYLVLELVEGETLEDRIARRPMPVEEVLNIAIQISEALQAAHERGIIHRDLKPANIKLAPGGKVKVLDFGLAKRMPAGVAEMQSAATLDVSIPGQMLGTFAYMSPEQIQGQDVDQRSDLFAFGIILYEMLAGKHPWRRVSSVDTLHAILHDDPAMEAIPQQMPSVVRKLLRKDPAERFFSAEAVREALAASSLGRGSSAVGRQESEPLPSIAVLPFLFLSEVEDRKALSLGFADALITTLGSLEDIAVLPTAAIVNCASGIDPARSCRELGVRHILQGSVQKQGHHWRVSTQLFDSRAQKIAYSEKHDFVMENVFEVQDEIGRKVVESLQSRLPRTVRKSRERYSSDPEAYAEFMAGLHRSYGYSREDLQSAAQHLSRAVALDPKFALAHAWLSHVAMQIYLAIDAQRSWAEKAEYHYQQALELDPDLPEAHWARAAILWSPAKSFQEAEAIAALERVLEARPNFDRAHNRMAGICMHIGRFEEAQTAAEHARRSNPGNRSSNQAAPGFFRYVMAFLSLYSGDFAAAREAGEALFRDAPGITNSLFCSVHSLLLIGDLDAAADRLRFALERYPDEPLYISLQGMLHARRNQAGAAMECVRKALDSPSSLAHAHHTFHHLACIYAMLGDIEKAMAWLGKSVDTGFPCWPFFQVDPSLENLRGEPRFQRLIEDLERKYTALKISRT